ncbi:MAG TPA: hypothetical protein VMY78_10225 [Solirubrobacteraceae bacterium]|nr:hypothetical protein [Solirubrobacteraceae bacterium]
MNRSSLKYLLIGLLVGGLATSGMNASALVSPDSTTTEVGAAAVKKKKKLTKKQLAAKKKRDAARKKAAAKKKKAAEEKKKVATAPVTATPLIGLFRFTPGAYSNGTASGSYIRLVLAGGTREAGPFFPNPSSSATTYTLLRPGTDGGLRTGGYQPAPDPAFSGSGDALANRIIAPQRFAFIQYSVQTSPKDPQTGSDVAAPSVSVTPDGRLTGNLQAFAAQWNKQNFNVGSPKPDGSYPGLTSPVSGTYNSDTKQYTLEWTSQIVGGAFNNFSAMWHFEGTFEPGCAVQ